MCLFTQPRSDTTSQTAEAKEALLSLGYKYFQILMRMTDLDTENRIKKHSKAAVTASVRGCYPRLCWCNLHTKIAFDPQQYIF